MSRNSMMKALSPLLPMACLCLAVLAEDKAAPPPVEEEQPSIEVITDPAAIEAARKTASETRSSPMSDESFSRLFLKQNPGETSGIPKEELRSRCVKILKTPSTSNEVKSGAAALLLQIDPKSGSEMTLELVNSGNLILASTALSALAAIDLNGGKIDMSQELREKLFSLFKDGRLGGAAMRASANLSPPGTCEALWKSISDIPSPDGKTEALYWLSTLQKDRVAFDACAKQLQSSNGKMRIRCLTAIENFFEAKDKALVTDALELAADTLAKQIANPNDRKLKMPLRLYHEVLAKGNGPKLRELIDAINKNSGANFLLGCAYTASCRLDEAKGLERLMADLDGAETDKFNRAVETIRKIHTRSKNERIVAALSAQAQKRKGDLVLLNLGMTALAVGGDKAAAEARSIADRISPQHRGQLLMAIEKNSPYELAQRLAAAGILTGDTKQLVDKTMDKLRKKYPDTFEDEFSLFTLLETAGTIIAINLETPETPPAHHDRLLLELAKLDGSWFKPESCHEILNNKDAQEIDPPYQVQFIHGGKLYRFNAENRGGWYDLESVIQAANKALEDAKSASRFHTYSDGGDSAYAFSLTPEKAAILADKFHVSFDEP